LTLDRRRFLQLGLGGGVITLMGFAGFQRSAHAVDTVDVWRLNAEWGYAVPPNGRTRCRCTACHAHAASKVFTTQAAAIAGRIHLCCVCQPESLRLLPDDVAALFPGSTTVIDLRHGTNGEDFEAAVARATAAAPGPPPTGPLPPTDPPTTEPPPTAPPTTTTTTQPGVAAPTPPPTAPSEPSDAGADPAVDNTPLPVTGGDNRLATALGVTFVGLGVAAVAAARQPTAATRDECIHDAGD
jgi:hypothetical protein